MKGSLVLNTHAWVWYLASPEVLPKGLVWTLDEARAREALYSAGAGLPFLLVAIVV